jgi:ABC-type Fe3+ transport system substrate-binding protein
MLPNGKDADSKRGSLGTLNRRHFLATSGLASAGLLAGCLGGGSGAGSGGVTTATTSRSTSTEQGTPAVSELSTEAWRELASEKAAEEGGTVVIASSDKNDGVKEKVYDADFSGFDGVYEPLSVEPILGQSGELSQRFGREYQADERNIDILEDNGVPLLAEDGMFVELGDVPGFVQAPDDVKVPPYIGGKARQIWGGLYYNTELVSDPPRTYEDLLDERWADGKILLDWTPYPSVGYALLEILGEEYLQKLGEQEPKFEASAFAAQQVVAQGDALVHPFGLLALMYRVKNQGGPLAFVDNPDLFIPAVKSIGISDKARHPWSAKLFLDWLMRPENEAVQAAALGYVSLYGNVSTPPEFKDVVSGVEAWTDDIPGGSAAVLDRFAGALGAPQA